MMIVSAIRSAVVFCVICVLVCCLGLPTLSAPPLYRVVDLGTLGGSISSANSINDVGEVVGWSGVAGSSYSHPFIYKNGAMSDLGIKPGDENGTAYDINNAEEVVGESDIYQYSFRYYHPVLYTPSSAVTKTYLSITSYGAEPYGINDYGSIAGRFTLSNGDWHAFVWKPSSMWGTTGTYTDLGLFAGGKNSVALDINWYGTAVGWATNASNQQRAVRWKPNAQNGMTFTMEDLGGLPNAYASCAIATVDNDISVGYSHTGPNSTDPRHAVRFAGMGAVIDLGVLPGFYSSTAEDINGNGTAVVGYCTSSNGSNKHGFVHMDNTMYDLNNYLDCRTSLGWTILYATGINGAGTIVGAGKNAAGQTRAVMLVPVADYPTPSISSISPDSVLPGSPTITLTVNGHGFIPTSSVRWNGNSLTTTYVSETEIRASIPSYLLAYSGTQQITVVNPEPGGGTSNAVPFNIIFPPVPPVACDDSAQTDMNKPVDISVLWNDYDTNSGDSISVTGIGAPEHGTASLIEGNSIRYTPNTGFFGTDTFQYTISDSTGLTASATVTVLVKDPNANKAPIAVDDSVRTPANTPIAIRVLANDSDPNPGDTISLNYAYDGYNGTVSMNSDGTICYQPNSDFVGSDSFPYWIMDSHGMMSQATVYIEVGGDEDTEAPTVNWASASTYLVAAGDAVIVQVEVTDDYGVASVTVNGAVLHQMDPITWGGTLTAENELGDYDLNVEVRDTSENVTTCIGYGYKVARVAAVNTRSINEPIMQTACNNFLFAVFGTVTVDDENGCIYVEDGSGSPVKVIAYGHTLTTGDHARIRGRLLNWEVNNTHIYVDDVQKHVVKVSE